MDPAVADLHNLFLKTFGSGSEPKASGPRHRVHIIRAPGRVNLIGEHTDYNEGFVFPMAIEPEVRVACRLREDAIVRLASTAFPGEFAEFSVQKPISRGEPGWSNYSRGVAGEFEMAGIPLSGIDALISNTLPVGGGLSSSAAIEVATALALLAVTGSMDMDRGRIALLCQKAEHEYAGVPVGIMDQTAVAESKAGHAMLLDCRDLSKRFIPLDSRDLRVVIANSMVKHELNAGEYAKRRKQCEEGVAYFSTINPEVKALRDVTPVLLQSAAPQRDVGRALPANANAAGSARPTEVVFRRCRHVVTENARAVEAAGELAKENYERFGELMVQSHNSLRDDYEVSAPELDFLVEESLKVKGIYGARMTGGGFGGCIVALTQPRAVEPLIDHLATTYQRKFNVRPAVFATTATAGASVIE